ncbi:hypothetical protein, partial [Escherichia coli]
AGSSGYCCVAHCYGYMVVNNVFALLIPWSYFSFYAIFYVYQKLLGFSFRFEDSLQIEILIVYID